MDEQRGGIKHQGGGTQIVVAAVGYNMGSRLMVPQQEIDQSATAISAADLPSVDPHMKGQLWSNGGTVTISQG
jgi:hypothetical protein